MLKIFIDTEFTGLIQNTSLISMALVAETGEEFYAEFIDYNKNQLTDWLKQNVVSNCFLTTENLSLNLKKMYVKGDSYSVKIALVEWLNQFGVKKDKEGCILPSVQIWADVPHYDWILFCELFGGALNIPKQIHYMPMDLATLLFTKGIAIDTPRIKLVNRNELPENLKKHNALFDAKLGLNCLKKYIKYE